MLHFGCVGNSLFRAVWGKVLGAPSIHLVENRFGCPSALIVKAVDNFCKCLSTFKHPLVLWPSGDI